MGEDSLTATMNSPEGSFASTNVTSPYPVSNVASSLSLVATDDAASEPELSPPLLQPSASAASAMHKPTEPTILRFNIGCVLHWACDRSNGSSLARPMSLSSVDRKRLASA